MLFKYHFGVKPIWNFYEAKFYYNDTCFSPFRWCFAPERHLTIFVISDFFSILKTVSKVEELQIFSWVKGFEMQLVYILRTSLWVCFLEVIVHNLDGWERKHSSHQTLKESLFVLVRGIDIWFWYLRFSMSSAVKLITKWFFSNKLHASVMQSYLREHWTKNV